MKKVIVISTSLRPGSNSHALAEQFAKGAEAAGHNPGGGGRRYRGGCGRGENKHEMAQKSMRVFEKKSQIYTSY